MSFPLNFVKFLKTSFFKEHLRWLLLSGGFSTASEIPAELKPLIIISFSFFK